jgi:cell division protein FtsL
VSPGETGLGQATGRLTGQLVEDVPAAAVPERERPDRGRPDRGRPDGERSGQQRPDQQRPDREGAETEQREEQRRHLRLVESQARRRAGRRRLLVMLGIACVAFVGLALVGLHVLIAENQFRLDNLQQQAATEQASYEKLRLQVAELEAPARIVSQAEGRLGMVQPATVTYLPAPTATTPTSTKGGRTTRAAGTTGVAKASSTKPSLTKPGPTNPGESGGDAQARTSVVGDPPTTGTVTAPQGDSDWPTVKPYLSGSP